MTLKSNLVSFEFLMLIDQVRLTHSI